jgi:hypothetical protein
MDENLALSLFLFLALASAAAVFGFARSLSRKPGGAGWKRVVLGNVLFLFLLGSLALVGGELYYRFIYDTTDSLDYTKVSVRWFRRHYRQNSWGCRDDVEYANQRTAGRERVAFLGDSFTAGHGVKAVEDTFPFLLRRAHPEWEVQVLARPGFDTGNEIQTISALLTNRYELGRVVLVYCLNDISDAVPECGAAMQHVYADVDQSGWLRRSSYFINTVYNRFQLQRDPNFRSYFRIMLDAYRGPIWQVQKERLKTLRDLVETHGGRLSVVTFPFLQSLGPGYEYGFVHEQLGSFWREQGVPHLDLLTVYQGMAPGKLVVNRFDGHPNEQAHRLAAEAIDRFLREQPGKK